MIDFPAKALLISKWRAYKGVFPTDVAVCHRIIIIPNSDPLRYFYVTSQVENCKRINRYDLASIAELEVCEWDCLTSKSCIQCDKSHLCEITEQELRERYGNGKLKVLGEVPEVVKQKILAAIEASKTYSDREKLILMQDRI